MTSSELSAEVESVAGSWWAAGRTTGGAISSPESVLGGRSIRADRPIRAARPEVDSLLETAAGACAAGRCLKVAMQATASNNAALSSQGRKSNLDGSRNLTFAGAAAGTGLWASAGSWSSILFDVSTIQPFCIILDAVFGF